MQRLERARRFDLHVHTSRSDGRYAPDEVLARAAEAGLDVVAVTDHDLASGMAPGTHRFGDREVTLLAGAEISGIHEGVEYHLLAYFRGDPPTSFHDFCAERCRERAVRYETSVASLGLPDVPEPDAEARAGDRAITRYHLARALVDAGHARDVRDAFARFADHKHGHVPCISLPFVEAIQVVREAGGVACWAHPPMVALERHLPTFVEAGLQGLEGNRPRLNARERRKVRKLAKRHGLFLTGGSDWHGWTDGDLGLFHVHRWDLSGFLAALEAA